MAAEMPEHTGDPSGYPWLQHSVAVDGNGFVVADLWPSEEAFGCASGPSRCTTTCAAGRARACNRTELQERIDPVDAHCTTACCIAQRAAAARVDAPILA